MYNTDYIILFLLFYYDDYGRSKKKYDLISTNNIELGKINVWILFYVIILIVLSMCDIMLNF